MIIRHPAHRRVAATLARSGVIGCTAMLAFSAWSLASSSVPRASAAEAGSAQVIAPLDAAPGAGAPLESGGSATEFSLLLPTGAACTGDSANGGYRWQTYVVPSSVDPFGLTFDANGPVPLGTGEAFRQPLYDAARSPVVDKQTAAASPAPGLGPIVDIPAFTFSPFAPGDIPAGSYNVGIACTLGPPSATQLDKFWNVVLTMVADEADKPAGVLWTASAWTPPPTTTTSAPPTPTTTTTRVSPSAATNAATSVPATTSTTAADVVLASSSESGGTPGASGGSGPSFGSPAGLATDIARTGASTTSLAIWGLLLVIFGRMAVLLGRTPEVLPATAR